MNVAIANEVEQNVIGAVLIEPTALAEVRALLPEAGVFNRRDHQATWQAILEIDDAGNTIDVVTVAEKMECNGALKDDSLAYLAELHDNTATAANAAVYAAIVRDEYKRRQYRALLLQCREDLNAGDPRQSIAELQIALDEAAKTGTGNSRNVIDLIAEGFDGVGGEGVGPTLLPTGLPTLDYALGGFAPGRLYVVAARPGGCKSALLISMFHHIANGGHPVGLLSLEMTAREIAHRLFAQRYDLNVSRLSRGYGDIRAELDERYQADPMSGLPMFVDDTTIELSALLARAAEWCHRERIAAVFIDYIGLVEVSGTAPRYEKIGQVTRSLKQLAKRLDIPVVAACQVNRAPSNENRPPRLSDLRDSGSVEQDADAVIFLHRTSEPDRLGCSLMEFVVAKNRNGTTGESSSMIFNGKTQRFVDESQQRRSA